MNMEIEKLGDIFADGGMINLDSVSVEKIDLTLEKIKKSKEMRMNNINELLAKIQM